jgi:hypothetical protein
LVGHGRGGQAIVDGYGRKVPLLIVKDVRFSLVSVSTPEDCKLFQNAWFRRLTHRVEKRDHRAVYFNLAVV